MEATDMGGQFGLSMHASSGLLASAMPAHCGSHVSRPPGLVCIGERTGQTYGTVELMVVVLLELTVWVRVRVLAWAD